MIICKRIISAFMAVVITFMLFAVPKAEATLVGDAAYAYTQSSFAQWIVAGGLSAAGYAIGGSLGTVALPGIGTVEGTQLGMFLAQGATYGFNELMAYLAEYPVDDAFQRSEEGFVDGLDRTEASAGVVTNSFTGLTAESTKFYDMVANLKEYDFPFFTMLERCGVNDKVMVIGGHNSALFGFYFDAAGALTIGRFKNPADAFNSSFCTLWDIDSLTEVYNYRNSTYTIYYSYSHAASSENFVTSSCAYIDWESCGSFLTGTVGQYWFPLMAYTKPSSDFVFSAESSSIDFYFGYDSTKYDKFGRLIPLYALTSFSLSDSFMVFEPTDTDSSSRLSALANSLNQYNLQHNIQDNDQHVNFVLVPIGVEPSLDTSINPGLYDEETLVYTDPVTGSQYLTHGWTYDYNTRCYTLDMADTFVIGDTVIDTIKLTYGDELLTVDHYADGVLIQSDEYNYVMMSGSACSLNGHTYDYTNVSDPTCTAPGERKYTCTVCGDSYAEEIPQIDHVYANYTVTQDATCTAYGIASYTCSACGGQYTELLDKLGHDWQPTASTEEAYVMPDGVSCPDCHGTDFTWTRQDLELKTGKNLFDISKVPVMPESSTAPWVSEVGSDYLVVTVPDGCTVSTTGLGVNWSALAPGLTVGETYTISFAVNQGSCHGFYVAAVADTILSSGDSFVATDSILATNVRFYSLFPDASGVIRISNIQIEKGTTVTGYEPYNPEYVEIVPPIYTFTCSGEDCGAVWMQEAEYQGASVTFSCARCGAEKIEVEEIPIDEEGWFDFMGDLLRSFFKSIFTTLAAGLSKLFSAVTDLFSWIFGFLTDTVLTGIKTFFDSFRDDSSIFDGFKQENEDGTTTVVLPSGVATVFQFASGVVLLLPDDLRLILIFGIAALFVIGVFKLRP